MEQLDTLRDTQHGQSLAVVEAKRHLDEHLGAATP